MVGGDEAGRVRPAGIHRRGVVVDHMAAEDRDLQVAHLLERRRAGLGELAGDAAHLDHGGPRPVRQHHRHLQDDLQLVPDAVGREVIERLGAVSGLEQERLTLGHGGQRLAQGAGLAGEHERGQRAQDLQ